MYSITHMFHFIVSDIAIGLADLVGHRPLPLPHHHKVLLSLLLLVRQTTLVTLSSRIYVLYVCMFV